MIHDTFLAREYLRADILRAAECRNRPRFLSALLSRRYVPRGPRRRQYRPRSILYTLALLPLALLLACILPLDRGES